MAAGSAYAKALTSVLVGIVLVTSAGLKPATAGGPLLVGSPTLGTEGIPITWDTSVPIPYRVDGGPLSVNPSGAVVIDNATAVVRIQGMFQVWQDVPTATISYTNAGSLLSTGTFADGDVNTVEEFDAVVSSCLDGTQSPIIQDADGSIFAELVGKTSEYCT